jgi:hypothetical protein
VKLFTERSLPPQYPPARDNPLPKRAKFLTESALPICAWHKALTDPPILLNWRTDKELVMLAMPNTLIPLLITDRGDVLCTDKKEPNLAKLLTDRLLPTAM